MPHQVLARKWRPRSFQEVVGQTTVVRALSNALEQNRLHHAYLLTGTRGVGKTTIARLLAKSLNCEQGVTANPCNQCRTCQSIDQGRFLDLLEIDAASRTKVEDTRDLLDNVQYAPTQGRYKVYLIDEVHMLSNHSFNALLKTLEEPPPHVKFLLATTDPQRLPVTVLSRCLQLHLKNLSAEQISKQLAHILDQENITYESAALRQIAQAAQGSMRDGLSLLDQAIAYGEGQVQAQEVKTMLGSTEPELLLALLHALRDPNAAPLLALIAELAESGVDFHHALEEMLSLLHQIALHQAAPTFVTEQELSPQIAALASNWTAEEVQLYYQIGLIGRRDLPLAPTARSGFEMVLLRMLAFRPQTGLAPTLPVKQMTLAAAAERPIPAAAPPVSMPAPPKTAAAPKPMPTAVAPPAPAPPPPTAPTVTAPTHLNASSPWAELLPKLHVQGAALVVASHCALIEQTHNEIHLSLDPQHALLLSKAIEQRIAAALHGHFQRPINVRISIEKSENITPAALDKLKQEQRQSQMDKAIHNDGHVQALLHQFNAQIVPNSIKAKDEEG